MSEQPWIKTYPPGTSWHAPLRQLPLTRLLGNAVARWPSNIALSFEGRDFSYAELASLSDRMAEGLQRLSVRPGMHVGLYLPNAPHYFISFFAVLKAGATVVNYSPLDAGAVLKHKIEDSHTDLIVTLDAPGLFSKMEGFLGSTRLQTLVVGSTGEFNAGEKPLSTVAWDAQRVRFADLLVAGDAAFVPHAVTDLGEVAVLQYTGGTTGHPKGAMLTHANLSSAVSQVWHTMVGAGTLTEGEERFLAVLPLFHIYSMVVNMLFGLSIGAEVILQQRFDLQVALDTIVKRKVSVFLGVPTMFVAFTGHPDIERTDLSSLKFCNSGGAPIAAEVYANFVRMAQCRLQEGWGMTETCTMATSSPGVGAHVAGSCGIPVPGVEVKVIDLNDPATEVPLGERGELCIRGPNVMKGYWNRPDATAESMTLDGYLRTGDVGYMTDAGFVYIVDRTKDMMICGGFNVYPRNIEEAIYRHPSVEEVIVIGIPDAYRGQSPKAFIKYREGATPLTLDELRAFLVEYLGKHEMVHAVETRSELPKTAVGKLSKKDLYAEEARSLSN
ncbi:MAG: long-chain fatty acid--CoA ligase [Variovorax sp.]|nr:MAG: long-chain fatty acid--CoA ligase [Variovorax sp.]